MISAATAPVREDVWLPTMCDMCYNRCNIQVHRVDGVLTKIEGVNATPNYGKTCAKGNAAFLNVYSPHRVKAPMVRTNPAKGVDVDPGWREITWDEAIDLMVQKLDAARQKDPRTIILSTFDATSSVGITAFMGALGSPNRGSGAASFFCGNGVHPIAFSLTGSFDVHYDVEHSDYMLLFGSSFGFVSQRNAMGLAQEMADARMRGLKLVVVDPICTQAAAKADEWIPIRPGTDAAFALAMQHVLVNELGLYDVEFLRRYTNAPYLVGPDGHYARDPEAGKPLVWDQAREEAVPYDATDAERMALEGEYPILGVQARPGFQVLKAHLTNWTPERAEGITTVPASTTRRVAQEFGEAARIGATITIQGYELPHRPAVAAWYRGTSAHKHGMHHCMAIAHLDVLIGAIDVPGGVLHSGSAGPGWGPVAGVDGLLIQGPGRARHPAPHKYDFRVRKPETLQLVELFPVAIYAEAMIWLGILDGEKFGLDYKPEVLIQCRTNPLATGGNPEVMAEALRRIPFIVSMSVFEDETTQFADLLLPDTHALERLLPFVTDGYTDIMVPLKVGRRTIWRAQLPVVEPQGQARYWIEVLFEVADRLGLRRDLYTILNARSGLSDAHKLDPERTYTFEELFDRSARSWCGDEHGLDYFKQHGYHEQEPIAAPVVYPRVFNTGRVPLYLEHFLSAGEQVRAYMESRGIERDTSDYVPLVHWQACPAFSESPAGYDLFVVNQKQPILTHSFTAENPWLTELAEHNDRVYTIGINAATARAKDIADGDVIELETPGGYTARAPARLTQGIHPECLTVPGVLGRKVASGPRGKWGVHYNSMLRYDVDRLDTVSCALDACVRVRVRRVAAANGK